MIKIHGALIILTCSILLNNISLYSQEDGESSFYDRKSSMSLVKEIFATDDLKYMIEDADLYKKISLQTEALLLYFYSFKDNFSRSDLLKINGGNIYNYIEFDFCDKILYNDKGDYIEIFAHLNTVAFAKEYKKMLSGYDIRSHGYPVRNLSLLLYDIKKRVNWELEKVKIIRIERLYPLYFILYDNTLYTIKNGALVIASDHVEFLEENYNDEEYE